MIRVLVSACLLGERVRYNGAEATSESPVLARWTAEGRVVPFCPEVAGGLGVPRPPAEHDEARWRDDPATVVEPGDGSRSLESLVLDVLADDTTTVCLVCGGATDVLADGAIVCGDCGSVLERATEPEGEEGQGPRGVWVG